MQPDRRSYVIYALLKRMARPGRLKLPTLCLEGISGQFAPASTQL